MEVEDGGEGEEREGEEREDEEEGGQIEDDFGEGDGVEEGGGEGVQLFQVGVRRRWVWRWSERRREGSHGLLCGGGAAVAGAVRRDQWLRLWLLVKEGN